MGSDAAEPESEIEANVVVDAVREVYAEEEAAVTAWSEQKCQNSIWETALTFLPFIGDLLDSSCIAPEFTNLTAIQQKADAAIARIERKLGFALDEETKQGIREDIRLIWRGY